jgi:hypothetical protein
MSTSGDGVVLRRTGAVTVTYQGQRPDQGR